MHIPVLLKQTIDGLAIAKDDIVVDGTLGGAGHSKAIFAVEPTVRLVGIDVDTDAIDRAKDILGPLAAPDALHFFEGNFADIAKFVAEAGFDHVDKILLDLGWSSFQLGEKNAAGEDTEGRGFSFQKDEPLSMSYRKHPSETDLTAEVIVNEWEEKNLADVIYGYGEETYSRGIAKGIVEAREKMALVGKRISTTGELAEIIARSVPFWYRKGRINPATKTFQALRIAVNDELGSLEKFLAAAPALLAKAGRIAIISFHSLEDRIVKRKFRELADSGDWKLVVKKPIVADREEILENPRSRSAKLRIIEKIS